MRRRSGPAPCVDVRDFGERAGEKLARRLRLFCRTTHLTVRERNAHSSYSKSSATTELLDNHYAPAVRESLWGSAPATRYF